jgi:hypothetical protein
MSKRIVATSGECARCGAPLPWPRGRRRFCSDACKQAAYRQGHAQQGNGAGSGISERKAENTPSEAPGSPADGSYRNAPYLDTSTSATRPPEGDGSNLWLWIDPRLAGWKSGADLLPYLALAVDLFANKATWGGRSPQVIRAHPDDAGNGLGPAAAALGLAMVGDLYVPAGTFRLGLGNGKESGKGEAL